MASYSLECSDPGAAIDKIGALIQNLVEIPEKVDSFNQKLGEDAPFIGGSNGDLVNQLIAVGGGAMKSTIDAAGATLLHDLLHPAFDLYISQYGTQHAADTRTLV